MEAQILHISSGVLKLLCPYVFVLFVFGYDLIFLKFRSILSDDFWGIDSC